MDKVGLRRIVERVALRWPQSVSLPVHLQDDMARRVYFEQFNEQNVACDSVHRDSWLAVQADWLIYGMAATKIANNGTFSMADAPVDEIAQKLEDLISLHGIPQLEGTEPVDGSFDPGELKAYQEGCLETPAQIGTAQFGTGIRAVRDRHQWRAGAVKPGQASIRDSSRRAHRC